MPEPTAIKLTVLKLSRGCKFWSSSRYITQAGLSIWVKACVTEVPFPLKNIRYIKVSVSMVRVLYQLSLGAPFPVIDILVWELFYPLNAFVKWYTGYCNARKMYHYEN